MEYKLDDSLRNNDSYSVTLDFMHGDATAGSAALISLGGSFSLQVNSTGIWGSVGSYNIDSGEKRTDWIKLPGQDFRPYRLAQPDPDLLGPGWRGNFYLEMDRGLPHRGARRVPAIHRQRP